MTCEPARRISREKRSSAASTSASALVFEGVVGLDEAGGCAFANEGSGFAARGELGTDCEGALVVARAVSGGRGSDATAGAAEDSLSDFGEVAPAGGVLGAAAETLGAGLGASTIGGVVVLLGVVAAVPGAVAAALVAGLAVSLATVVAAVLGMVAGVSGTVAGTAGAGLAATAGVVGVPGPPAGMPGAGLLATLLVSVAGERGAGLAAALLGEVAATLGAGFAGGLPGVVAALPGVVAGVPGAAAMLGGAVGALTGAATLSCSFSCAAKRLV
jgi:hypothetical protein